MIDHLESPCPIPFHNPTSPSPIEEKTWSILKSIKPQTLQIHIILFFPLLIQTTVSSFRILCIHYFMFTYLFESNIQTHYVLNRTSIKSHSIATNSFFFKGQHISTVKRFSRTKQLYFWVKNQSSLQ